MAKTGQQRAVSKGCLRTFARLLEWLQLHFRAEAGGAFEKDKAWQGADQPSLTGM